MLFDRRMTVRMDRDSERSDSRPPKLPEGLRSIGMGLGAGGNPLHDVPRNYLFSGSPIQTDEQFINFICYRRSVIVTVLLTDNGYEQRFGNELFSL